MPSSSDCEIKYNIVSSSVETKFLKTIKGRLSIGEMELALKIKLRIYVIERGKQLENLQDMGLDVM